MENQIIDEMTGAVIEVPLARVVKTGRFTIPNAYFVLVRLRSGDDVGIGYCNVLRREYARPLGELTSSLKALVEGQPADRPENIWNVAAQQMYKAGPLGMATWAV